MSQIGNCEHFQPWAQNLSPSSPSPHCLSLLQNGYRRMRRTYLVSIIEMDMSDPRKSFWRCGPLWTSLPSVQETQQSSWPQAWTHQFRPGEKVGYILGGKISQEAGYTSHIVTQRNICWKGSKGLSNTCGPWTQKKPKHLRILGERFMRHSKPSIPASHHSSHLAPR